MSKEISKKIEKGNNIPENKKEVVIQLKSPEAGEKGQNITIEESPEEKGIFYITSESGIRDLGKEIDLEDNPWGLGIKIINEETVKSPEEYSIFDGTGLELSSIIEWKGKDGELVRISTQNMNTTPEAKGKLAKIEASSLDVAKEAFESGDIALENYSIYDI